MITNNALGEQEERPAPTVPVSDPRSQASNLEEMRDPYQEASKRRELAEVGSAKDR